MDASTKERRRLNQQRYRERNPEKVKARAVAYRTGNREQLNEAGRQYYRDNQVELLRKKREYVKNNRQKVSTSKQQTIINRRNEALTKYGGKHPACTCCGEQDNESLCIDHVRGGGNAHRRSINRLAGYAFYVWLKQNKYPDGFRVLCLNCNDAIALFGCCPHRGASTTVRSKSSQYFHRVKMKVLTHYSNGEPRCAQCLTGYVEFLCLDHNGVCHVRKMGERGGWRTYKWAIDNGFPPGFQVLCFRCNFLKWVHRAAPEVAAGIL
jgi:hypothetical protein